MSGPYAWVRNPLYLANLMIYTSLAWLLSFNGWWTAAAGGVFGLQYSLIVAYEEAMCLELFGNAYAAYCGRVRRWIPTYPSETPPVEGRQESWKEALVQERRGFLAVMIVLAVAWARVFF
jgi:hypothetical protein